MRQASSENTFALEELADELAGAKNCQRARRGRRQSAARFPNKSMLAAEEFRLLSGDDAPASVPNDRMAFSADADAACGPTQQGQGVVSEGQAPSRRRDRLVAYVRAATARDFDVLAAQNTPAEPSKERERKATPPRPRPRAMWSASRRRKTARATHALAAAWSQGAAEEAASSRPCRRRAPVEMDRTASAALRTPTSPSSSERRGGAAAARQRAPSVPDRVASIWENGEAGRAPTRWSARCRR